jgi:hypothetical protein
MSQSAALTAAPLSRFAALFNVTICSFTITAAPLSHLAALSNVTICRFTVTAAPPSSLATLSNFTICCSNCCYPVSLAPLSNVTICSYTDTAASLSRLATVSNVTIYSNSCCFLYYPSNFPLLSVTISLPCLLFPTIISRTVCCSKLHFAGLSTTPRHDFPFCTFCPAALSHPDTDQTIVLSSTELFIALPPLSFVIISCSTCSSLS